MTKETEIDNEHNKVAVVATKEVAKLGHRALDLVEDTRDFFDTLMGDLVKDGLGLISDRLKYYRLERATLLAIKVQRRLEAQGITSIRPVVPKFALPIIEAATIEDDDELHDLWANLLATAMHDEKPLIKAKYISIIKTLDADDVRLLQHLNDIKGTDAGRRTVSSLMEEGFTLTSMQHLYSEGVITISFFEMDLLTKVLKHTSIRATLPMMRRLMDNSDVETCAIPSPAAPGIRCIYLTSLGEDFLDAVIEGD